jgi:hypothetical protein
MGRNSRSTVKPIGGLRTVFCDEAGFTGNNLLDRNQEVFAFVGVALSHGEAENIVQRTIRDFRLQGTELKGSHLLKTENGRRAITAVIRQCARNARVVCHLKKYALACKFFEYIFEPALADQNSIFYASGFHAFISTLLFLHLRVRNASAEATFEDFAKFMREGDKRALQRIFPGDDVIVDYASNPLQAIGLFAMLNRRAIIEELDAIRGDGSTPNWVLDLTTTSLSSVLCYWGERYEQLDVYCDRSKPIEAEADFLKHMVGRKDRTRFRIFGKERQLTYNLLRLPEMADSRKYPGIQIADVIASAVAGAFQNRWKEQPDNGEREWMKLARQSLLDDNIWPDLDNVDLRLPTPFVNSSLLLELAERSLKRQDLFDGIPEFIEAMHRIYPKFLADIRRDTPNLLPATLGRVGR